jgi:hypothetical protein
VDLRGRLGGRLPVPPREPRKPRQQRLVRPYRSSRRPRKDLLMEWRVPPVLDANLMAIHEWLAQRFPELMGAEELRQAA